MLVSIVTPTTGNPLFRQATESIQNQDYPDIEHIIVIDGKEREARTHQALEGIAFKKTTHRLCLPFATGKDRYNGHRIYGLASYLINGDYIVFLDEDNWLDRHHIASLVELTLEQELDWAYSLRKIFDSTGSFITLDDCDSLGKWPGFVHESDYHIDTSCFFIKKQIAVQLSPIWYRKYRQPGILTPDAALCRSLLQEFPNCDTTGLYTVNYRAGSSDFSVGSSYFLYGNARMRKRYPNTYPWRKEISQFDYRDSLKETLSLRKINLIACPDWRQPEADLSQAISVCFQQLCQQPHPQEIALLLFSQPEQEEKATAILWDCMMEVLSQLEGEAELESNHLPEINIVAGLSPMRLRSLRLLLSGRLRLMPEDTDTIAQLQLASIPCVTPSNLTPLLANQKPAPAQQAKAFCDCFDPSIPVTPGNIFLIVSHPGAGLETLADSLQQHPQLFWAGEIFHANATHPDSAYASQLAAPKTSFDLLCLSDFLNACTLRQPGKKIGFSVFPPPLHQLDREEIAVLIESGYQLIFLHHQNLFEAFSSLQTSGHSLHSQAAQNDAVHWIQATENDLVFVRAKLKQRSQPYLTIASEELHSDELSPQSPVVQKIFRYLDVRSTWTRAKESR